TAVQNGTISRAVLNTMVSRILTEMFRFNLIGSIPRGSPYASVTTPAHVAVGTTVADDSATLLRNAGGALPLSRAHAGTIAVTGPSASVSPTGAGGGSAYVIPSQTVTPLQGLQAAAGAGTTIDYQQGLPADSALAAIPAPALSPAYAPTPFGGSYSATLTAPETGTYVLALTNPCGCYIPTYLYLNGQELLDNPGTAPVAEYSVAVDLTAGHTYMVRITGESSELAWATPADLAPGIAAAAAAAKAASAAVVVVSDDTESEASDRPSLELPSAQNELIEAVAAANPRTIVVIDAGAPVAMPWLDSVASVLDAWYPGETNGTALANVLFGSVDPSGHLPVTFPTSLAAVPASTPAQFPGVGGQVHYSEGIDVGYRWYDVHHVRPLFAFGYGLSYTRFAFSDLRVSPTMFGGVSDVHVSATVTNTGHRSGADVAQLYLGDPPATGEPPRQLAGFDKVTLAPGQSTRVRFTITPRDTWWWDQTTGGWSQTAGQYHVYVGDSSAPGNLPLHGAFTVTSTAGARRLMIAAPRTIVAGRRARVRVTLSAGGDASLSQVTIALQAPQGWTVKPHASASLRRVAPDDAPSVTFTVKPPSWEPATNEVVHLTAALAGNAQRQAGATIAVR
ncbi:MAG: glycoside hydrolase family 3 C-terminal domain-containing protein, partial [Solirubrobacteraceae bacterium]